MESNWAPTSTPASSSRGAKGRSSVPPVRRARFGEFEVLGVLGRGGMATVALARSPRDRGLPDLVALKFLNEEHIRNPDTVDAFEQEARLGTLLRHQGLCRAYGMERIGSRAAIILEHVPGYSLGRIYGTIRTLGSPREQSLALARIGLCIAAALRAVHEARDENGAHLGAVHRDISPQNVIVTPDGGVKVIDFGVMFSSTRHLKTQKGLVKGKLAFMAPEYLMARGWNHQVDLWSLGVILWEMVVGKRLFPSGDSAQFMRAVAGARIPPLVERCPLVAPELSDITERALQREPRSRYPDAATMVSDLASYLNRETPDAGRNVLSTLLGNMAQEHRAEFRMRDAVTTQQPSPWDQASQGGACTR